MHESCSCLSCARTKHQKAKVTKTSSHKFNNCRSVLALRFWQMQMWVTVVSWQATMNQRIHSFEQQLLESQFVTNRLWRVMRVREKLHVPASLQSVLDEIFPCTQYQITSGDESVAEVRSPQESQVSQLQTLWISEKFLKVVKNYYGWFSMSPLPRLHHHDIMTIVELYVPFVTIHCVMLVC